MPNTLLILGAGSSKSVNHCFPTGFELIQSINAHLFNDTNDLIPGAYISDLTNKLATIVANNGTGYENELKVYKKKLYHYVSSHEVEYLRKTMSESFSIDDFASKNKENILFQTISKYATSHILKGAEHAFYESTNRKSEDWIEIFLKKFTEDTSNLQNLSHRLQIVSFNYDRLFSYLFKEYLKKNHPTFINISTLLEESCIHFLYGSLGSLNDIPFESPNDDKEKMICAYKKFQLLEKKKKNWVSETQFDTIGFIGFGFDKTNFDNLNLKQFSHCKVYSSYHDLKEKDNQSQHLESIFKNENISYCETTEELAEKILNPRPC